MYVLSPKNNFRFETVDDFKSCRCTTDNRKMWRRVINRRST